MVEAPSARADRKALSNGPIIRPELTIGRHPEPGEPIAQRREFVVAERAQPGIEDFDRAGAEFDGDGDEAFEAGAVRIGARAAGALQAEMISQAIRVEARDEGAPARRRIRR